MNAAAFDAPPRSTRLAAVAVSLAPALVPVFPLVGLMSEDRLRGMGGAAYALVFVAWSVVMGCVVLLVNAWLIRTRCTTFGLAYADLVITGARPGRLLAVGICVALIPPFCGLIAAFACSGESLQRQAAFGVPAALYAVDWAVWLGPARRTLAERLSGGRVVRQPSATAARRRSIWPDVLLLGPPILLFPLSTDAPRGIVGGLVAIAVMGLPVLLSRTRT